jgi:hypothetical protein
MVALTRYGRRRGCQRRALDAGGAGRPVDRQPHVACRDGVAKRASSPWMRRILTSGSPPRSAGPTAVAGQGSTVAQVTGGAESGECGLVAMPAQQRVSSLRNHMPGVGRTQYALALGPWTPAEGERAD